MRTFRPTLEHVVMAGLVVAGMVAVNAPIGDNSMLVHIRTGMNIADTWSIPRADPYSFTANGDPWIVQSWLPEAVYGLLVKAGGAQLIIVLHLLLAATAAAVMVSLARSTSMVRTLVAGLLPISLAWASWTQRPLLFAIVCFALAVYVTLRKKSMWWLLPIAWVWVNSHGSFPIGIAWLTAFVIGERLDNGSFDRRSLRCLATFVGGVALGAVNPLGPKLLLFFTSAVGERAKSFADIVEWGSPSFHSISGVILAVTIVAVVAVCFRSTIPWRFGLPVLGLLVASLYSSRHLSMLAVAVCPLLSHALSNAEQTKNQQTKSELRVAWTALALVALTAVGLLTRAGVDKPYDFKDYPVAAVSEMQRRSMLNSDLRLLSRETTGCYLIWRNDGAPPVFIDDRIDMYPASVSSDYRQLFHGSAEPQPILDKYGINAVLWDKNQPLFNVLSVDPRWQSQFTEGNWTLFIRS